MIHSIPPLLFETAPRPAHPAKIQASFWRRTSLQWRCCRWRGCWTWCVRGPNGDFSQVVGKLDGNWGDVQFSGQFRWTWEIYWHFWINQFFCGVWVQYCIFGYLWGFKHQTRVKKQWLYMMDTGPNQSQNWLFNGLKSIGIPIAQPIPLCWFMSTVDGSCQAIDVHRSSSTPTPCRRLWDPWKKGIHFGTSAMNGLE